MPIQVILFLVLTSLLLLTTTASSPPSCTDELVFFSPCLAYVSLPPNRFTNTISNECCDVVSNIFDEDETNCFCYLTKRPSIFGFPLNQTRVVSLPLICISNSTSLPFNHSSLNSVCSGSRALPPLRSSRGSVISDPISSNVPYKGPHSVHPPSKGIPPNSDNSLPESATPMGSNFPASPSPTSVEESSSAKDMGIIKFWHLLQVIVGSVALILVEANAVISLK